MTSVPANLTRFSGLVHRCKVWRRQLWRALSDRRKPIPFAHRTADQLSVVVAENRTPLFTAGAAESALELGKVQNLRLACSQLNGITLEPGQILSFWRQVGRCRRRRGYVVGRQLQEGCLIPAVGGGICQLSNALYQAAMDAGLTAVERHAHSRVVPGSAAERGDDATVAWNYVDLRLQTARRVQLETSLSNSELIVRIRAEPIDLPTPAPKRYCALPLLKTAQACDTCNEVNCFRHAPAPAIEGCQAFVVDAVSPDWLVWLAQNVQPGATLISPLDGVRWSRSQYAWPAALFSHRHYATRLTLWMAWRGRRMPPTSGARQARALARAEALAIALVAKVPFDASQLVVSHELLPFAWASGALGGRRFTVLQGRQPMAAMQSALDAGAHAHPESRTLADFRAPTALIEWETAALAAADRIVTPHIAVAEQFGSRAELIPWSLPPAQPWKSGPALAYGGPTAGRKGAYEVREAARRLKVPLVVLRGNFEGPEFWDGLDVTIRDRSDSAWLDGCFALVQPALVEERPRALLHAIAAGVPTIATAACGIEPTILVPALDVDALIAAVRRINSGGSTR